MKRKVRIEDPNGHVAEYFDLDWGKGAVLMVELEGDEAAVDAQVRELQMVAAGIWKRVSLN